MSYKPTTYQDFAKDVAFGLRSKQDSVMAITGRERKGKTTWSILFAMELSKELGKNFAIRQNLVYGKGGGLAKIEDKSINPIVDDEGTDNFNKVDRWEKWQQDLMKIFTKAGMYYKAYLICMPNFFDFTKYWREWRFRYWVWIPFRGKAVVFAPSENPFGFDSWNRRENEKLIYRVYKGAGDSTDKLLDGVRRSKNYLCEMDFPDLEPELKAEYEAYSWEYKRIKDEAKEKREEHTRQQVALGKALHLLRAYPKPLKWDWDTLARYCECPDATLREWISKIDAAAVPKIPDTKQFRFFARKVAEKGIDITKLLFTEQGAPGGAQEKTGEQPDSASPEPPIPDHCLPKEPES